MAAFPQILHFLKVVLVTLVLAWAGLAAFALIMANRMIFPAPPSSYQDSGEIVKFRYNETGDAVSTWYLPNPEATHLIFYQHGNGEDLGGIVDRLRRLHGLGFAVFAWDYPGYGTSDGRPNQDLVFDIADQLMRGLPTATGFDADRIVLYGRSLGGGPATWLATRHDAAGLILEGTFTSTFRVMTRMRLLPWDIFDNLSRIGQIRCPVLILHGNNDEVVPFQHGQILLRHAPEPKSFTWFDGGRHNDLVDAFGAVYDQSIQQFFTEKILPE